MHIPASVVTFGRKAGNWFVKNGPNLMRIGGGAMAIGGAVMACKATLHADEVLDAHRERMAQIEAAKALSEENNDAVYTDKMMKRDKAIAYLETAVGFGKLYGPAVAVGLGGVGLMNAAWCITESRRVSAVAALTSIDNLFAEYRARVAEEYGDEAYDVIWNKNNQKLDEEMKNASDEYKQYDDRQLTIDATDDPFFFIFDEQNPNWYNKAFLLNERFLQSTIDAFNYRLSGHAVDHVWMNDILKAWGMEETSVGSFYGWNSNTGDIIEYEITPYLVTFDGEDDEQMPMYIETDKEAIYELESNDIQTGYCFGIRLKSSSEGYDRVVDPRMIYHEVYGE